MTRSEARATNSTRYIGKTCTKHPDLLGQRETASASCIGCKIESGRAYYARHAAALNAKGKKYREANREAVAEYARQRIHDPTYRPAYLAYQRSYYTHRKATEMERSRERRKDPEYNRKQVERKRAWRTANAERHAAKRREYEASYLLRSINRRIAKNIRNRVRKAILGQVRSASAVDTLGISIEGLKAHLRGQFLPGMDWDNYGQWHIDHIVPLASFDLSDADQFRQACHYSNLQPLWALDNHRKHCRLTPVPPWPIQQTMPGST